MAGSVEEIQQRIAEADLQISRFDQREREINEALQNTSDRGERNRLFNEADSLAAGRQSFRDDRNKYVRQLKIAQGQAVLSRREIAEREGKPFNSSAEYREQQLADAFRRAQEAKDQQQRQSANQRLLERAKATGAQAEANYRLNQAIQQGTLKPTDIIQRGTQVPLTPQNRQAIVTAISASEANRAARIQQTAAIFAQGSTLNTGSSQPSGNDRSTNNGNNGGLPNGSSTVSSSNNRSVESLNNFNTLSIAPNTLALQRSGRAAQIQETQGPLRGAAATYFANVITGFQDTGIFAKQIITDPISVGKQFANDSTDLLLAFRSTQTASDYFSPRFQNIVQDPAAFGGRLTSQYFVGRGLEKGTTFAVQKGKNIYVSTGSEFVPPETVFAPEVLAGKQRFPTQQGLPDSVAQFQAAKDLETGKIKVVSATDVFFDRSTVVQAGARAKAGLEDPGLFVAPYGRGSPYFLNVNKADVPTQYTFNPITATKSLFKLPNAVVLQVDEVKTAPKTALQQPGFKGVADFYQTQVGQNKAFITKRSIIGDTSEVEAIIPENTPIRNTAQTVAGSFKGFDQFTRVNGVNVPLRNFEIVQLGKNQINPSYPRQPNTIAGLERYSSSGATQYKTPYSYSPALSSRLRSSSRDALSSRSSSGSSRSASSSSAGSSGGSSKQYLITSESLGISNPSRGSFSRGRSSSGRSGGSSGGSSIGLSTGISTPTYYPSLPTITPREQTSKKKRRRGFTEDFLNKVPGFNTFVRRRVNGKRQFVQVGDNLTQAAAYNLGQDIAQQTSVRSFKVEPSGRTIKGDNRLPQISSQFRAQYRKSSAIDAIFGSTRTRANNNVFVEKSRYAINTGGELRQITYKGLAKKRRRKLFGGF